MAPKTRDKILEVASTLFAEKGYLGTSIRDIAQKANVNVAAINYHFSNKETLYWEIYLLAYQKLERGFSKIDPKLTLEDFSCEVFNFLYEQAPSVKNIFKLFLAEAAPVPENKQVLDKLCHSELPPGGAYLLKVIQRELGNKLDKSAQNWLVRSIFSFCVHWTLRSSSVLAHYSKKSFFKPHAIRTELKHQVRAFSKYLSTNPTLN